MESTQKVMIFVAALMLTAPGDCAVSGGFKPVRKRHIGSTGAFAPSFGVPGVGLHRFPGFGPSFGPQVAFNPDIVQNQAFQSIVGQNLNSATGIGSAFSVNAGIAPSRHTFSTIDNAVGVRVPQPVPVEILRHVPVPIRVGVPVDVPRAVHVSVPQAVGVPVPRAVPVDVPRAVAVRVPQAVPVAITRAVGVPVPQPIAVQAQTSIGDGFGLGIGLGGLQIGSSGQGIDLDSLRGIETGRGTNTVLESGIGFDIGQLSLQSGRFNQGAVSGDGFGHGILTSGQFWNSHSHQ